MDETVLFGRYRLLEPAGRGGSAQVWRAIDERTGDEVAVKRLHPVVLASEAGRRRLVREFRALRSLHHPSIVAVRDLELTGDDAALVLDFVPGPSLRERLAAGLRPAEAQVAAIVADLADALSTAHARGIVHRDVSPGNILLGPDGRARLTDFGIARDATEETTAATQTGSVVGTLRYMSPEQLRGRSATPRSDLYGLAAVAYEMLAGRPAFPATTPVALAEAQQAGAPPIPGVSQAVDGAVRQGLALDPADRPPTVRAFAAQLAAAVAGVGTGVPAAGASIPAGAVAVAAALVMAALILVAALSAGPSQPDVAGAGAPFPRPTVSAPPPTPAPEQAGDEERGDERKGDGNEKGAGKGKEGGGGGRGGDKRGGSGGGQGRGGENGGDD